MPPRDLKLHGGKRGIALAIRVTTRAKKNEVIQVMDDGTIKIRITSPPIEGKANQTLIEYLSTILEVPKSRIEIIAGEKSRDKLISILDLDTKTANQRISDQLRGNG
jgi:uncharacterized protein (TIGR00251 family)